MTLTNTSSKPRWIAAAVGIIAIGLVSVAALSPAQSAPETRGKTTSRVGDHQYPSTSAPHQGGSGYAKGTKFTILCKVAGTKVKGNPRWYAVGRGWVPAAYVKVSGPAPKLCPWPAPSNAYIESDKNVPTYSGPSTKDVKRGFVRPSKGDDDPYGYRVACVAQGEDLKYWYYLSRTGTWVKASDVKRMDEVPSYFSGCNAGPNWRKDSR